PAVEPGDQRLDRVARAAQTGGSRRDQAWGGWRAARATKEVEELPLAGGLGDLAVDGDDRVDHQAGIVERGAGRYAVDDPQRVEHALDELQLLGLRTEHRREVRQQVGHGSEVQGEGDATAGQAAREAAD